MDHQNALMDHQNVLRQSQIVLFFSVEGELRKRDLRDRLFVQGGFLRRIEWQDFIDSERIGYLYRK